MLLDKHMQYTIISHSLTLIFFAFAAHSATSLSPTPLLYAYRSMRILLLEQMILLALCKGANELLPGLPTLNNILGSL